MASVLSLLVCVVIFLSFIPIQSNIAQQLRFRGKRRSDIGEFDIRHSNHIIEETGVLAENLDELEMSTRKNRHSNHIIEKAGVLAKNLGERLETQLGRGYEKLGHRISDLGLQIEENKDEIGKQAADFYTGSLADETGKAYENVQYGYGKMGDGLSAALNWLGVNIITLGHNMGSIFRSSFHTIGDFVGNSVDKTEHLVGQSLVKTGEKVHVAAADLERNSHQDGENMRAKLQKNVPDFERAIGKVGHSLHVLGVDTEAAGEVMEQNQVLETLKRVAQN